jgi:Domain of unknown function (DUF4249)
MRILLSLIVISGSSCDPVEINADIPDVSGMISVNSYVAADSTWIVDVARVRFVLRPFASTDFVALEDAKVLIYEGDEMITELLYRRLRSGAEHFFSVEGAPLPQEGKTYKIVVSVDGHPDVTANCTVPRRVPILYGALTGKKPQESGKIVSRFYDSDVASVYPVFPVEIWFDDPPGANYYEMMVKFRMDPKREFEYSTALPMFVTRDASLHDVVPTVDLLDATSTDLYYAVFFKDGQRDGQRIAIDGFVPAHFGPFDGTEFQIILRNVSEDYYKYQLTREVHVMTRGSYFAQPANVHNNIQNGIGVFAGYSESDILIKY